MLGIARRAGAVQPGTQGAGAVQPGTQGAGRALETGAAKLVLVAADASPVQLKKIEGMIRRREVPRATLGDRVLLGAAVGEPPLSALAVTDAGLAREILRRLEAGASEQS